MKFGERLTIALGLVVILSGITMGSAQARGEGDGGGGCPQYACPSTWDAECGSNNSPQAICAAAGCSGDLAYSYCSSFAGCFGGRMGARCIQ